MSRSTGEGDAMGPRGIRIRILVLGALLAGIGGMSLAGCADRSQETGDGASAAAIGASTGNGFGTILPGAVPLPVPPPAVPPPSRGPITRVEREVRSGEPLDLVLSKLELTPEERSRAVERFGTVVDLRRILPGETVAIARDGQGNLVEAVLVRNRLERVVVRWFPDPEGTVEVVTRAPTTSLRRIEGTLEGSLYEAVVGAGGDANLTMRYADLLAWQVDFLTEPRAGDEFRILVREDWLDGERLGFGKILFAEYRGAAASARAIRYVDEHGVLDWYDDEGGSVRRAFLRSPLEYRRISSRFSARRKHPILKRVRPHWGVDYAAPRGTPVSALGDGVVTFAGRKGGYGNYVEIRHNATHTTCYGHLWKFARGVRKGTRLAQGEVLGYVGSTGLSTGPHLDFRVKEHGKFVDPLRLEVPPGRSIPESGMTRYAHYRDRVHQLTASVTPGESVPEEEAWGRLGTPGVAEHQMAAGAPGDDAAIWFGVR